MTGQNSPNLSGDASETQLLLEASRLLAKAAAIVRWQTEHLFDDPLPPYPSSLLETPASEQRTKPAMSGSHPLGTG